jgi:[ribosomal protein S5]-alanine N-acetyltransferase
VTLRFPPGMEPLALSFPGELERGGVRLRLPTLDDVDAVAPAFLDPDVGGEAGMPPFEPDDLRTFVTHVMPEFMATGRLAPYVIEAEGQLVGGISLHHFDDARRSLEVGYWLYAHARGRGLASRAVAAVVDWAFASGVRRVEAVVRLENEQSSRVLERLGFRREGVKRRLLRYSGGWADATLYARLADE